MRVELSLQEEYMIKIVYFDELSATDYLNIYDGGEKIRFRLNKVTTNRSIIYIQKILQKYQIKHGLERIAENLSRYVDVEDKLGIKN